MEALKRHPFSYTLGPGPYRFVRLVMIKISEVRGAAVIGQCNDVESGIGTCAHCGHAIMDCYIIQTGEGRKFGVGSDCIRKISFDGGFSNLSEFEKELRATKRKKGQERRELKRLELKAESEMLVNKNAAQLKTIPAPEKTRSVTMFDYCSWYLGNGHTLNGYKIFISKINKAIQERECREFKKSSIF